MQGIVSQLRRLLEDDLKVTEVAPPFNLTGLFRYMPLEPLSSIVPHLRPNTDLTKVLLLCHRKKQFSLGLVRRGGLICLTVNEAHRYETELAFRLYPPALIISWGPPGQLKFVRKRIPVIRFDKIATTVWSERFGRLSFRRLERSVLGAPDDFVFRGAQANRGVLVTCGLLVHLAYAAEVPSRFLRAEDIAGLGQRSKNPNVASECLTRVRGRVSMEVEHRLERHVAYLATMYDAPRFAPVPADQQGRAVDEIARREVQRVEAARSEEQARRTRRSLYSLTQLQELYLKRDRPLHRIFDDAQRRRMKKAWGVPVKMREKHYDAVLKAEGVSWDDVDALWALLTIKGNHDRYSKPFLQGDSSAIPGWRADQQDYFGMRHLLNHLLRRKEWVGYRPDVRALGPLSGDCDLRSTRVLVVDLDVHGAERLDLNQRFAIFREHLPGGLAVRSSSSGGLHLWYFLPKPLPVERLVNRVLECLGDSRKQLGRRNVKGNGWELKPDIRGNSNVRLFGGLGSAALDEELQPLDLNLAGLVEFVLNGAKRQQEELQYLLEMPKDVQEQTPLEPEKRTTIGTTAHCGWHPQAGSSTPQLIRAGDPGSWHNRARIVGRALYALGNRVTDIESAWATIRSWLLDPINANLSKHLASPNLAVVDGRLNDTGDLVKTVGS